jgi:hypothetical protein
MAITSGRNYKQGQERLVMISSGLHRTRHRKPAGLISGIIVGFVVFVVWILWLHITRPFAFRHAIVLVNKKNIYIISFTKDKSSAVTIFLPAHSVIDATYGYGKYSIDSLLNLDHLEKKHGELFTSSLSQTLGIPINGYATIRNESLSSVVDILRDTFSFASIPKMIAHTNDTSIPFSDWIGFVFGLSNINPGTMQNVDLTSAVFTETLPDGSTRQSLDTQKAEFLIGDNVYDTDLRAENATVSLYNTTKIPLVGLHTATLLEHSGISVITVANTEDNLAYCMISVDRAHRESLTVKFLRSVLDCSIEEAQSGQQSDIRLRLGKTNAALFDGVLP